MRRTTRLIIRDSCPASVTPGEFDRHFIEAVRAAAYSTEPPIMVMDEAEPLDELPRQFFFSDPETQEFYCGDCNERLGRFEASDETTQVWEFYSDGWLGPCICCECKLSIPVIINGAEEFE